MDGALFDSAYLKFDKDDNPFLEYEYDFEKPGLWKRTLFQNHLEKYRKYPPKIPKIRPKIIWENQDLSPGMPGNLRPLGNPGFLKSLHMCDFENHGCATF